jgi:hypothetical protein
MPARLLRLVLSVAAVCGLVGDRATAAEPAKPSMKVKLTEDFEVDGKGSAKAWESTPWTPLSIRPDAGHDYKTQVKMLYSKKGLYLLMDGTDSKLSAKLTKDYEQLWTEDVYEAFFWTDEKHPIYFEYEISPLNYELPILVPNYDGKFMGWIPWMYDGGRKTKKAIHIVEGKAESGADIKGWRAEVFIPYELLKPLPNTPPKAGTQWRANFYRMDYDGGKKSQWDWARVGPSFHEYQKYGTLIFE